MLRIILCRRYSWDLGQVAFVNSIVSDVNPKSSR